MNRPYTNSRFFICVSLWIALLFVLSAYFAVNSSSSVSICTFFPHRSIAKTQSVLFQLQGDGIVSVNGFLVTPTFGSTIEDFTDTEAHLIASTQTHMNRWLYRDNLCGFAAKDSTEIIGELATYSEFAIETTQRDAWLKQIDILRRGLTGHSGELFLEYSIPRMGRRVDAVVLIDGTVFAIEFKVGQNAFSNADKDQVWDYALDLKNFHEESHDLYVAPILVATDAASQTATPKLTRHGDKSFYPILTNGTDFPSTIESILRAIDDGISLDTDRWAHGGYRPTPTIVEAATALYARHSVEHIARNDAGARNLAATSKILLDIIEWSRLESRKSICFVTGVPGSGKTLVGLNVATTHINQEDELYSVFLSGNGPLVRVLREALVRDQVARERVNDRAVTKSSVHSEVKLFIQNVHNFRDDCLVDQSRPPVEHVAIFDEAQRAWNLQQTVSFMSRKKGYPEFGMSEPEYLISCLDRHNDWAVIVCLVGSGQEINTGEAGISEWFRAIESRFPHWNIWYSPELTNLDTEAKETIRSMESQEDVRHERDLHLAVSLRSFRSENVSSFVDEVLNLENIEATKTLEKLGDYPIVLTRNLSRAKEWLRSMARGSERYGVVVSSQAMRLKPHGIDVRPTVDPVHWFLNDKDDVRSSYYLEDVATEFHIQGLELDWSCVAWDADFRYSKDGWIHKSFRGTRWTNINAEARKRYLKNAYRVLLTRARQGMVIVVPKGDHNDPTRSPEFYDPTYEFLSQIGIPHL